MSVLYNRIAMLCETHNVTITKMCKESGASRASLSDLKMGRKQNLSAETLSKIASYFDVSVDYLIGNKIEKKPLVNNDEELTEYLEELRNRPEKRMLFSVTKSATKEQIEAIVKMIEEMQGH